MLYWLAWVAAGGKVSPGWLLIWKSMKYSRSRSPRATPWSDFWLSRAVVAAAELITSIQTGCCECTTQHSLAALLVTKMLIYAYNPILEMETVHVHAVVIGQPCRSPVSMAFRLSGMRT